jgi:hypothetical protein
MMPTQIRNKVFDKLSGLTMRKFFTPISLASASGLVEKVLIQSQRDFFINGTITSHASCPPLMAGMWSAGREVALTNQHLPAWQKKAMGAALSDVNRCPYCEDFLLSLTHGANESGVVSSLLRRDLNSISDELLQKRLAWTKASITRGAKKLADPPFAPEQMPEALGTLVVFNYTNKISDFTMKGSPIPSAVRGGALRMFGMELKESAAMDLEHGASLHLLPPAELTDDLSWAASNSLVADGLARWNGVVEAESDAVLPSETKFYIRNIMSHWGGGPAPISRNWVEDDVAGLGGKQRDLARVALLVAKASYQIDDGAIQKVVEHGVDEAGVVRLGAWSALLGAKVAANFAAQAVVQPRPARKEELLPAV